MLDGDNKNSCIPNFIYPREGSIMKKDPFKTEFSL